MKWIIAGLFALLALGVSIVVPFWVLNEAAGHIADLEIPLLAISGFLGVFACVALLVLAFQAMGLADVKQALGMPEGSVRALIAIFLIVTLGMTALFLLGPQRYGQSTRLEPKTSPTQDKLEPNTSPPPQESPAAANATPSGGTTPSGAGTETKGSTQAKQSPKGKSGLKDLSQNESKKPAPNELKDPSPKKPENAPATTAANQDGGDLAKQFLTLVGGLVTTIVGFYFGSQTANSAASKAAQATAEAIKTAKS